MLSPNQVMLIDLDEQSTSTGEHFTKLVGWLGFKDCVYENVRHDNRDGYDFDAISTDLGPDCRLEAQRFITFV